MSEHLSRERIRDFVLGIDGDDEALRAHVAECNVCAVALKTEAETEHLLFELAKNAELWEQGVKTESFPDGADQRAEKNEVAQVPLSKQLDGKNTATPLDQICTSGSQNHLADTMHNPPSASIDEKMNSPTDRVRASELLRTEVGPS